MSRAAFDVLEVVDSVVRRGGRGSGRRLVAQESITLFCLWCSWSSASSVDSSTSDDQWQASLTVSAISYVSCASAIRQLYCVDHLPLNNLEDIFSIM